jgi:hypothetical protein
MLGIGWEDAEATIVSRRLVGKTTEPDMGEFAGQGVEVYAEEHKVEFDRADSGTCQHIPGVPDWRHHEDPLKEADREAVADAHSAQAQAEWDARLQAPPGS